ncbi:MAG: VCBS repeat-containing protein [Planctomycetota bacterium]
MNKLATTLLILVAVCGCRNWAQTRDEVLTPIQSLLHRKLPAALASADPFAMRPLYTRDAIADGHLLANLAFVDEFASIAYAEAIIENAVDHGDEVIADVRLAVGGIAADGGEERRSVLEYRRFKCEREDGEWRIETEEVLSSTLLPSAPIRYADEAKQRGIVFDHKEGQLPDPQGVARRYVLGAGAAVTDLDGNGWEDVILASATEVSVFLNEGGYFSAAPEPWQPAGPFLEALTFTLVFDHDNNGHPDLLLGLQAGEPVLLANDGSRLVRVPNTGLEGGGRSMAACAADFDGDGLTDVFIGCNEDPYWRAPEPMGEAANAKPDRLFLNNGDGTFRDVTAAAGVGNTGWTLVCAAADYDADGDVDIFVGNDFGLDVLYRNDGQARFENVANAAGVDLPIASMCADWGDFDGDGDLDLFVGGMASNAAWMIDHRAFPTPVPWLLDVLFPQQVRREIRKFFYGNRMYVNQGDGTFVDRSAETGTHNTLWAWGSLFYDCDNDGLLDLYGANGFISGPIKDDL